MKTLMFFLIIGLVISCSSKSELQNQLQNEILTNSIVQNEIPKQKKLLEKPSTPTRRINSPDVKDFGYFAIIRSSDKKDKNGWVIPPHKEAKIEAIFSNSVPQIGEKVTVVPLQVKLEPFQISISKVTERKHKNHVENKEISVWKIEMESITDKEILEIEPARNHRNQMPFSVFVIYPSVEFARSLSKTRVTKEMIPKDVALRTIEAAIDLDNDNKPDLLSARFCCGGKLSSYGSCPYLCNKYYKKINGEWQLFDYDGMIIK